MGGLIFEPHAGFGGTDPDDQPWPFGHISEGLGLPIFELSTLCSKDDDRERLTALALKMAAALELYRVAELVVDWLDEEEGAHKLCDTARAALAKASGK